MQGVNQQYLLNISNQFIHILKTLETCKGWQLKQQQSPLSIEEIEHQGRVIVKSKIKVNVSFETVLQFFSNPSFMQVLSDAVRKFDVLYENKDYRVIRLIMEPPGPISKREIVAVNTVRVEGNRAFCGNRSCNYFSYQKDPDSVLADAHVIGFILDRIDANSTLITQIGDMDLKGSIPVFIQNAIASKRANSMLNIEEKIKNYKK